MVTDEMLKDMANALGQQSHDWITALKEADNVNAMITDYKAAELKRKPKIPQGKSEGA